MEKEDIYWRYSITTKTKLIPTFILTLAKVWLDNGLYQETIERLCKEQGKISDDGEEEFLSLIEDEDARPDEKIFNKDETEFKKKLIRHALEILDDREIQIIKNRHLEEDSQTLETLGIKLNISKERVRQIEKSAMMKMKSYISNNTDIDLFS